MFAKDKKIKIAVGVIFALAIAGIVCFVRVNVREFERLIISHLQQGLLISAKSGSQNIEGFIDYIMVELESMAKNPIVQHHIKNNIPSSEIIAGGGYFPEQALVDRSRGRFDSLYRIDAEGKVQSRIPFKEGKRGADYSKKPGVKFVLENQKPSVSNPFKTGGGKDAVSICYPVFEKEEFIGMLRILVYLETISNLIQHFKMGERIYPQVIDDRSVIISHPDTGQIGKNIITVRKRGFPDYDWSALERVVEKMIEGQEGVGTYYSIWWTEKEALRIKKLTAFVPIRIGDKQWSIGIVEGYDVIRESVGRYSRDMFVAAEFLIAIFILGGSIFYRVQNRKVQLEIIATAAEELKLINQHLHQEVTERKRAEEEAKLAYAKLKEAQSQLVQTEKFRVVGQLASGVAHEVKNPLAIIIQSINYLENTFSLNKKACEVLNMIKESTQRADIIVKGLVDFSREAKLNMRPKDINVLLEKVVGFMRYNAEKGNIKLIRELQEGLPEVLIDSSRIEQIIINLSLNAIQAMPEGGKLTLRSYLERLEKPRERVGRRDSDYFELGEEVVIVEVEDTGTGIKTEHLNRVFDPFFTTKGPQKGSGLGLSVVKNLIDMHRGAIVIESQEGKGTKIIITLKVARADKNT